MLSVKELQATSPLAARVLLTSTAILAERMLGARGASIPQLVPRLEPKVASQRTTCPAKCIATATDTRVVRSATHCQVVAGVRTIFLVETRVTRNAFYSTTA